MFIEVLIKLMVKLLSFSVDLIARSAGALCEINWELDYKWGQPLF